MVITQWSKICATQHLSVDTSILCMHVHIDLTLRSILHHTFATQLHCWHLLVWVTTSGTIYANAYRSNILTSYYTHTICFYHSIFYVWHLLVRELPSDMVCAHAHTLLLLPYWLLLAFYWLTLACLLLAGVHMHIASQRYYTQHCLTPSGVSIYILSDRPSARALDLSTHASKQAFKWSCKRVISNKHSNKHSNK